MKYSIFLLPLVGMLATQVAWAEGSTVDDQVRFGEIAGVAAGNHGVNRVIRTPRGYRAVQGTVALSFVMPKNENALNNAPNHDYEQVNALGAAYQDDLDNNGIGESGRLDTDLQPLNTGVANRPQGNKPSAYLGGTFVPVVPMGNDVAGNSIRSQVDVGLQYEPVTVYDTVPGWSIFFYVRNTRVVDRNNSAHREIITNPRVYVAPPVGQLADPDGIAWRSQGNNNSNAISGTMTFEARSSGAARFSWTSPTGTDTLGEIYANLPRTLLKTSDTRWDVSSTQTVAPWGDVNEPPPPLFDATQYASADMKRVTAMTRDAPYSSQLDGSRVRADWTLCRVSPHNGILRFWNDGDVERLRTGYDAPRVGNLAFDRRYNGTRTIYSRPIVEFAPIGTVSNDTLRRELGIASRYTDETVIINLGTLVRPIGSNLQ